MYASIRFEKQHPFMLAQFRSHGVMLERYLTLSPELKAQIEHAAEAQRAHADGVRSTLSVGGVDFAMKPRRPGA